MVNILAYVSGITPSTVIGRYCYNLRPQQVKSVQLRHEMHAHNNI